MRLRQIATALSLTVRAGEAGLDAEVSGGYAADLLSCAMAGAQQGDLWITLQGHLNVVAIATLDELAGILITEDKPAAPDMLQKADEVGVPVLSTPLTTYQVAGRLWEMGVRR
jgi:predicted transcriptional regulator